MRKKKDEKIETTTPHSSALYMKIYPARNIKAIKADYTRIKSTDLIVFASPLYFWTLSSRIKAFIERFYCIAEEDPNPPLGRYEKYPVQDNALLMTAADGLAWR